MKIMAFRIWVYVHIFSFYVMVNMVESKGASNHCNGRYLKNLTKTQVVPTS